MQNAIYSVFGIGGHIFIAVAMALFAFTTLIGNLYYADSALAFLNHKERPSLNFRRVFYVFCVIIIFIGALIPMDAAWTMADITMGILTLINLPVCVLMVKTACGCLKDYESQKKAGREPVFKAESIGIDLDDVDHGNEIFKNRISNIDCRS